MNKTLKEILVISIIYLIFRLSLYNLTTIAQSIQITSSILFGAGIMIIYFIKADVSNPKTSLSLSYFPIFSEIVSKKRNKIALLSGEQPTFQVQMNTSAKLNHKKTNDEINFQISLEYELQLMEARTLASWDEGKGNEILKELLSFSKISISGLPDKPVLTVSFGVLSISAYRWEEVISQIKGEADKVNTFIKPFLSIIVPILAPILFQQGRQGQQGIHLSTKERQKESVEEIVEEEGEVEKVIMPAFPREEINWSYLYNFTERESAVEEV
jgi:hypothetical protein